MTQKPQLDDESLLASLNGDTMDMSAYKSNVETVGYQWKDQLEMKLTQQRTFKVDFEYLQQQ